MRGEASKMSSRRSGSPASIGPPWRTWASADPRTTAIAGWGEMAIVEFVDVTDGDVPGRKLLVYQQSDKNTSETMVE